VAVTADGGDDRDGLGLGAPADGERLAIGQRSMLAASFEMAGSHFKIWQFSEPELARRTPTMAG
jgi:hypothetical protein